MRFFSLSALLALTSCSFARNADLREAQVNRAIELTKSRQMNTPVGKTSARSTQNTSGRSEAIDVSKLNLLIRALDKTWVFPRLGSKDPIGSNFQYKKTCSSIFKARHGACQQLTFGVMCFNYCHEQGEKLVYRCQDTSDASYCRQSGTFETFLAKYRRDGYKAKTYIHQMISRCYATAICNTQTGILNSTLIDNEEHVEVTKKMNRLRFLTRGPKPLLSKTTATTMATEEVEYVEEEEADEELATTTRRRRINEKKRTTRPKIAATTTPVTMTTKRRKIWTRSTVSRNPKNSSKSLPIWRRLLSTTTRPSPESIEIVTEESVETNPEDEEDQVDVNMEPIYRDDHSRPMPVIVPMPGVPEVAIQKPSEKDQAIWKRFQPDRWFESIRHITNTGK